MESKPEDSKPDWYPYSNSDLYPDSISYLDSYTYWYWSWNAFPHSHSDSESYSESELYLDSTSDSDLHTEQADEGKPTPSSSKDPGMSAGNLDEEVSTTTEGPDQLEGTTALTVTLPTVAAIFVLLLFVCLILLWKKTRKGKTSESSSNTMNQELGKGKEVEKLKDQTPVEMSVTSWNHYTHPSSNGERKEGTHYAEVDETLQPIAKNSSHWNGAILPSVSCKDNAQGGHEYEDANILGRQMNDGHGKTKGEDPQNNQGYEKEANRGTQNDTGYKTDLLNLRVQMTKP